MLKRGDAIWVINKTDIEKLGKLWGYPVIYMGTYTRRDKLVHWGYCGGHGMSFNKDRDYVIRRKPNETTGRYFNCEIADLLLEKLA